MSELIKTKEEIEEMRKGGRIAASILNKLKESAKPGVTTLELDYLAERLISEANVRASFKGFGGYPAHICTSINEEVVHGIPSKLILKEGDILGIDLGILCNGFHTDTALTCAIGKINPDAQKLIEVTKKSLDKAISIIRPGIRLGDIGNLIQSTVEKEGFSVVRDLVGHGIGKDLQEKPSIPNYGKKSEGLILKEGMTLAIEPMVNTGDFKVKVLDDGWTVVTLDKSLSAHFEHTIVVTKTGAEILTK